MNSTNKKLSLPVLALIGAYLLWQILMPLRHYLIPGDARMTFEGLSFSWRLKAEVYRAPPVEIYIDDQDFISENQGGSARLDWQNWSGDTEIYCQVDPREIDWHTLPEIVVLFEPDLGDRVLYNPLGHAEPPTTMAGAQKRVLELWQRHFGRRPSFARTMLPVATIEQAYRDALFQEHGLGLPKDRFALDVFLQEHGRCGDGKGLGILRRLPPFTGRSVLPKEVPFIVIEDAPLFEKTESLGKRLDRTAWSKLREPMPDTRHSWQHVNGSPLVIYTADLNFSHRSEFPEACVVFRDGAGQVSSPKISWDYHRSLGTSKGMHISTQPFLLRRYARQLASKWEKLHGRRPGVYAKSYVSLNFRPLQPLVDESVNLAEISVKKLRHNEWIHDLERPRIDS